jgi:hypothetical protein
MPSTNTRAYTTSAHRLRSTRATERSGLPVAGPRSGSGSRASAIQSRAAAAPVTAGTTRQWNRSASRPAPAVATAMPSEDAASTSDRGRWREAGGHMSPT